MTLLPIYHWTAAFLAVVAAGSMLAAPPAGAGLRDMFENVRDTVECSPKAVLNPLRVVDWRIKNFEKITGEEYERRADQSMKEALAECREAAENIVARGFGVKIVLDKARDSAGRAESAVAGTSAASTIPR